MSHPGPYPTPYPTDYTVVGAGAIGATLGFALARAGHHVTLIDTDTAHVAALRANGLRVRRPDGTDDRTDIAAAHTPDDAPAHPTGLRRVILATKSQHTEAAAAWAAPRLAPDGWIASAQNGPNEPVIAQHVGPERTLGVFVNIFADYLEPGIIRDGGPGALAVGLPDGGAPDGRVLELAAHLRAYGPVTATANLAGYRWAKRGFGAILGVTTLVDAPIAGTVDRYRDLAAAVARESTETAVRAGIALEAFDAYEPYAFGDAASAEVREAALDRLVAWLRTQPKDRSGVFRDLAVRHRPREHPAPGHPDPFPALAARHGVPLTAGTALGRLLGEIEAGTRGFSYDNTDELRRVLRAEQAEPAGPDAL
ncbi:2-dehydropantoate 2-reductase N-terminal domain-containing protein [Streptomyces sp. NPDC093109]|uniref:ketopantoate reductase family protein n=1 Tax=Streptomyces sp. NPDC093109 TaxID=3154977 RepID=UPI00344BAA25